MIMEDFNKPKIVYREIGVTMDACMVPSGVMINNKLYMVSGEHLEHLLHFFNSNIFNKITFTKANLTGGKGVDSWSSYVFLYRRNVICQCVMNKTWTNCYTLSMD